MERYVIEQLVLIGGLIVLKVVFSAGETSLLSVPRAKLQQYAGMGGLLGRAFRDWFENPNRILTSIVIGNNILDVAATMLAAFLSIRMADSMGLSHAVAGLWAAVAVAFATIFFGEVVPKVTGRTHAERIAVWLIMPLYLVSRLLFPVTWSMNVLTRLFVPRTSDSSAATVTEEDIKLDIELGVKQGTIREDEQEMIDSIFKFSDKKVSDAMIPRTDMFSVDLAMKIDDLVDQFVQHGYSRVPVYKGNRDNIVGVIHTRDLLAIWKNKELIVLHDLLRKPFFVPETMRVDRLLREFQRGKVHMAIVVDEYGGTAGIITLEDLIEEIVGEIKDEYDTEEEKPIVKQEDGSYLVDAGLPLDEVNEALGLHLTPKGQVATLGGYLVEKVGKVPKRGRVLEDLEAQLTVEEASDRRVLKARVLKREKPLEAEPKVHRKRKPRSSTDTTPEAPAGTTPVEPPGTDGTS